MGTDDCPTQSSGGQSDTSSEGRGARGGRRSISPSPRRAASPASTASVMGSASVASDDDERCFGRADDQRPVTDSDEETQRAMRDARTGAAAPGAAAAPAASAASYSHYDIIDPSTVRLSTGSHLYCPVKDCPVNASRDNGTPMTFARTSNLAVHLRKHHDVRRIPAWSVHAITRGSCMHSCAATACCAHGVCMGSAW